MATWSLLTYHLDGSADSVRLTWSELDRIVGGLPPSASTHRPWWYGDRPQVRAWRAAGFTVGSIDLGRAVTFTRERAAQEHASASGVRKAESTETRADDVPLGAPDVLLVSCVKSKLDRPAAAKDLYVSSLFKKERTYAENLGAPWFILSAEHGLVAPDEWLAPYERYLPDTSATYRSAWGTWVAARLELLAGPSTARLSRSMPVPATSLRCATSWKPWARVWRIRCMA